MALLRVLSLNLVLIVLVILVVSTAFWLDRYLPFQLPAFLIPAAWPLLGLGGSVIVWAVVVLARHSGATGAPGDPTRKLVTQGPFAWLRNPIYAADALLLLGLAVLLRSGALLLYNVLYMVAMDFYVRKVEEPRLERKFEDDYARYRASVPRWIPDLRRSQR